MGEGKIYYGWKDLGRIVSERRDWGGQTGEG